MTDNMKFTSYSDANEVFDELFDSPPSRYQGYLERSLRGKDLIQFKLCTINVIK